MVTPTSFCETRLDVLQQLMRAHPFATVVVQRSTAMVANRLSFKVAGDALRRAIVGMAVTIDGIESNFKLSQNHPAANQAGVIDGLRQRDGDGDFELAQLMRLNQEPKV